MQIRTVPPGRSVLVPFAVAYRPVRVALGALWWAISGCSAQPAAKPLTKAEPKPAYSIEQPVAALPAPLARDDAFRRGVSLAMFVSSQDEAVRKAQYGRFLDDVAALGATDLALLVRWFQTDVHAIEIAPHPTESIDDEALAWVMDEANSRKLRVFLMPIVEVDDRSVGKGRGTLSPSDWERWWWSYQRFIVHYARIAEGHKAALFSVGSELASTEQQGDRWRDLIAGVRKAYQGKLAYSADWNRLGSVSFWGSVDVVGITGHHALTQGSKPSDQELLKGFRPFAHRLRTWAMAEGKRYVFADLRHAAQPQTEGRPGDYRESRPADPLLELRWYRALFQTWNDDPRLEGVYARGGVGESSLAGAPDSSRKRPSAEVLRHWFKRSRK